MGLNVTGMSTEDAAMEAVHGLQRLCEDVGIPKMKDIPEIDPADFQALSEASERNVSTPSNPRPITAKDYLELFKKAYTI
jgi:alcohol dehydrogenase